MKSYFKTLFENIFFGSPKIHWQYKKCMNAYLKPCPQYEPYGEYTVTTADVVSGWCRENSACTVACTAAHTALRTAAYNAVRSATCTAVQSVTKLITCVFDDFYHLNINEF